MTIKLSGFIARETEKAIAFIGIDADHIDAKPFWIPRKKISSVIELDTPDVDIQLKGESISRLATPVSIEVDSAFAEKVGVA